MIDAKIETTVPTDITNMIVWDVNRVAAIGGERETKFTSTNGVKVKVIVYEITQCQECSQDSDDCECIPF